LVIIDPCPSGFASDFKPLSFIHFAKQLLSKLTHIEVWFYLQDLADSKHDPDTGIKKVIMPTFVPLRTNKWFDDRSLFSDEPLFLHKSRDENSLRGEGYNTNDVTVASPQMLVGFSYAAPQVHRIVNVALHREYSAGIVFIFSQGRKYLYHV
jgi:hypothetical protein